MKKLIYAFLILSIMFSVGCYLFIPKEIVDSEVRDWAVGKSTLEDIDSGKVYPESAHPILKQLIENMEKRLYRMEGKNPPEVINESN